ncbi:MAG TPA: hypothetical protein VLC09_19715 [Polyangiaceae bacterium]|nr:hypothetical protein [Polyangiaceae bacterium]
MANESSVLVVSGGDLPPSLVTRLEEAGLFVERTTPGDLADVFNVIGPDLVLHWGRAQWEEVATHVAAGPDPRRVRVVVVVQRDTMADVRKANRSSVASVLSDDMPEKTLVERVVLLAQKSAHQARTGERGGSSLIPLASLGVSPSPSAESPRPAPPRAAPRASLAAAVPRAGTPAASPPVLPANAAPAAPPRAAPPPAAQSPLAAPQAAPPTAARAAEAKPPLAAAQKPAVPSPAAQKPAVPSPAAQKPPMQNPAAQSPAAPSPAAQKPATPTASAATPAVPPAAAAREPRASALRIVLIDDDVTRGDALASALRELGQQVQLYPSDPARTRWAVLRRFAPDVIVADGNSTPPTIWLELLRADTHLREAETITAPYRRLFDESNGSIDLSPLVTRLAGTDKGRRLELRSSVDGRSSLDARSPADGQSPADARPGDVSPWLADDPAAGLLDDDEDTEATAIVDVAEHLRAHGSETLAPDSPAIRSSRGPASSRRGAAGAYGSSAVGATGSTAAAGGTSAGAGPGSDREPDTSRDGLLEAANGALFNEEHTQEVDTIDLDENDRPTAHGEISQELLGIAGLAHAAKPGPSAETSTDSTISAAGVSVPDLASPPPARPRRSRAPWVAAALFLAAVGGGYVAMQRWGGQVLGGAPAAAANKSPKPPAAAPAAAEPAAAQPAAAAQAAGVQAPATENTENAAATGTEGAEPAAPTDPLWSVTDKVAPTCETLVPDTSELRKGDVAQSGLYWDKARSALVLGDSQTAQAHLCRAVLIYPASLAVEALAEGYLALEAPARAKQWIDSALTQRPGRPKTLELLGDVEAQLGHLDAARTAWAQALSVPATDQKTLDAVAKQLVFEGQAAVRAGNLPRAELLLRRAAGLSQSQKDAADALARLYEARGRDDLAGVWRAEAERRRG